MDTRFNVNLKALESTVASFKEDPQKATRVTRIEGSWVMDSNNPQFRAEIPLEGGKYILEADQPAFLGGGGSRPGPIHYAIFGLAACFTATFVSTAAMMGLDLQEVRTTAEFNLNFSKVFGLGDAPIVEEVRVNLNVRSNSPWEEVEKVANLAEERCPATYCLTNPIKMVAKVAA